MLKSAGITLTELLASLTIVGIMGSLAAPSMVELRRNSERTAAVNEFFHAIFLARSEAIKRGTVVSLCKSTDGRQCSPDQTSWSDGYVVFNNLDRDEPVTIDPGEEVLQVSRGWPNGRITSNRASYSFRPYTQGVVNGTIVFCDPRGPDHARAIIISHTGRPRVASRDASQRQLRCD